MKRIILLSVFFASVFNGLSQNVGIGNTAPTHSLHITPQLGNDPLRVEGINDYSTETHLMVVDTSNGVVKKMPLDSLVVSSSSIIDSITYLGDTLYVYNSDTTFKVQITGGADTDVDSVVYTNDTLYVYENNKTFKTEILIPAGGGLNGYDTTEYLTGKVWIDGKPVYERVIHNYTGPTPLLNFSTYFAPDHIETLLDLRVFCECSRLGSNNSTSYSHMQTYEYNNNFNRMTTMGNNGFSHCGRPYTIIMEYTKQ